MKQSEIAEKLGCSQGEISGSRLNYVSDLFVMGGALIFESNVLLNWCECNGYGPFALHGISMGGYGIMSQGVDWSMLSKLYFSDTVYRDTIHPLIRSSIPERFRCPSPSISKNSGPSNDILSTESNDPRFVPEVVEAPAVLPTSSSSKHTALNASSKTFHTMTNAYGSYQWPMMTSPKSTAPDPEVRQFLRDLLDYFTHLGNFPSPTDSRLILAVTAEHDAYVPREGVISLTEMYPDAEVRTLPQSGHIGAYLRNALWTHDFRRAIVDCLNRQIDLHHPGSPLLGQKLKS